MCCGCQYLGLRVAIRAEGWGRHQKKEEGGWEDILALYSEPPALGVTILFSRSQWPGKWVRLGGLSGPGLPAAPAPLSWPLLTVGL